MTTVAEWVETVKDYVLSGYREEQDILETGINSSVTELVVTDAVDGIQRGAEIEIDLERMYVRSVSNTTVHVRRGYRGTTPATHATGAEIVVLPKFAKASILRELNIELASLSSPVNGVPRVATVDLTWSGSYRGYDLTAVTDVESILEVRWKEPGDARSWPIVDPGSYELARGMAASEFPSTMALLFSGGVYSNQAVRVRYSTTYTALTGLTQNVESVSGITASAVDIPPMGAAINLIGASEMRRSLEAQGDPRGDDDVPPGARISSVRWLAARRQTRIREEAMRFAADFPTLLAR